MDIISLPFLLAMIGVMSIGVLHMIFYRDKSMFLSILIMGIWVCLVVSFVVLQTFGVGVGIGLFWILSLIRFRETFERKVDIAYIFSALVVALAASLTGDVFVVLLSVFLLILVLWAVELLFVSSFVMYVEIDIHKELHIDEIQKQQSIRILSSTLVSLDYYKLRKRYELVFIQEKNA